MVGGGQPGVLSVLLLVRAEATISSFVGLSILCCLGSVCRGRSSCEGLHSDFSHKGGIHFNSSSLKGTNICVIMCSGKGIRLKVSLVHFIYKR